MLLYSSHCKEVAFKKHHDLSRVHFKKAVTGHCPRRQTMVSGLMILQHYQHITRMIYRCCNSLKNDSPWRQNDLFGLSWPEFAFMTSIHLQA